MITPEKQAYQDGRDDMRRQIVEKLEEERARLQQEYDAEPFVLLLTNLIERIESLT